MYSVKGQKLIVIFRNIQTTKKSEPLLLLPITIIENDIKEHRAAALQVQSNTICSKHTRHKWHQYKS